MCDCAGSNPQLDRLRQSSDVRVSLDDEEMREVDPDEHREALGAGIPQHLGLYARLSLSLPLQPRRHVLHHSRIVISCAQAP